MNFMTIYTFKPDKKKGRNKFVGSWSESVSKKIDLPFTVESLRSVLSWGLLLQESEVSHQDIAHWCDRFRMATFDVFPDDAMGIAIGVAADVDAQWDMFLTNTYLLEELQNLDFGQVCLPLEWFVNWLNQIENAQLSLDLSEVRNSARSD